jgi:hypothetical protein
MIMTADHAILDEMFDALTGTYRRGARDYPRNTWIFVPFLLIASYISGEIIFRNQLWGVTSTWQMLLVLGILGAIVSSILVHQQCATVVFAQYHLGVQSPIPGMSWTWSRDELMEIGFEQTRNALTAVVVVNTRRQLKVISCTTAMQERLKPFSTHVYPAYPPA